MSNDTPSYRMIVQNGRLVPAGPIDQERLLTYRDGTEVECTWKSVRNGVLIRRLYAVVSKAVKQCPTPWKTADEAVQALKHALGVVDMSADVRGLPLRYPRSLNDLDEPELEAFLEACWSILHKITGVDPLTLRREARDTDTNHKVTGAQATVGDEPASGIDGDGSESEEPFADGADPPVPADTGESGDPGGGETDSGDASVSADQLATQSDTAQSRAELIDKLFFIASNPDARLSKSDRLSILEERRADWDATLADDPAFVRDVFNTVSKVVRGELPIDAARRFVRSLA
ncbi:MAG: hypothetical protein QM744_14425 [Mesorhizobium sp.]